MNANVTSEEAKRVMMKIVNSEGPGIRRRENLTPEELAAADADRDQFVAATSRTFDLMMEEGTVEDAAKAVAKFWKQLAGNNGPLWTALIVAGLHTLARLQFSESLSTSPLQISPDKDGTMESKFLMTIIEQLMFGKLQQMSQRGELDEILK